MNLRILKEKGHQVICTFPEQFRNLAEDSILEFASLGTKFIDMLDNPDRIVYGFFHMEVHERVTNTTKLAKR